MNIPMPPPKYGFSALMGDQTVSFAPFDSPERAEYIRAQMGRYVECGPVMQVQTVTAAMQILASLKAGWKPDRQTREVRQAWSDAPVQFGEAETQYVPVEQAERRGIESGRRTRSYGVIDRIRGAIER